MREISTDNEVRLSAVQTAKEIRKGLKKAFPQEKYSTLTFSVTCRGGCVNIDWIDGPSINAVQKIIHVFEGCELVQNGGDMIKGYKDTVEYQDKKINFGIDYIFCHRTFTERSRAIIHKYVEDKYGPDRSINKHESGRRIYELEKEIDETEFNGLVWAPIGGEN